MIILDLFESKLNKKLNEGVEFGSNYAEQLAQEVFNHNPNIKDENQVLNLGYNISKNDLGRKAQGIFRDEDFPSDFISAYFWLQKQGVAEGAMPASVIKSKQRYAEMTPAEFAKAHGNKSDEELQAMAWRHGYGKGSNYYVDKRNKGKSGVAEGSLNEFAPGNSGDDDYDDNDDRSMEATFTIFSKGKAHTGTVIIFPGVTTDVEYHLNGKIYIKNDMDNVYDYDDFITDAADYIQEIIKLEGDGHHFVEQGVAEQPVNEISPHDYDSDEDYYAAMKRTPRVPRGRSADDYDYDDEPQDSGDDESYYEKYVRTKNLEESVFLKEDRQAIYEQWNKVGKRLVEYKLTPQQVQNIFTQVEKASTAAGGNRTMVGRGVDKATELNNAWEGLKDKIQQSHPVKGFDDLYDKAAAKLKQATGGDQGVMQYVNKYRNFAKEHPYIQSAVYAALIAAAGLSGAGLGGAGALGLLKMTDRLLQGDKASSALYKGAKTGALAYGASQLAQYFKNPNQAIPPGTPAKLPDGSDYVVQKGDTLSQIAQKNGVSVKDLMQANSGQAVPTGDQMTWNQPDQFGDVNAMGDAGPSGTGAEQTYDVRTKLTNPDVLKPGQKLHIPGSLGPTQTYADNVGTAADTWDKVKSGAYSPSEISRNQAAKWNLPGAGEYNPPAGAGAGGGVTPPTTGATDVAASAASSGKPELTPKGDETNYAASKTNPWEKANAKVDADVAKFNADAAADAAAKNAKASAEYSDFLAKNPGSPVAYDQDGNLMPGWVNDPEKPGFLKFNAPKLKESQIFLIFDSAVAGQRKLNEGIWDTVKGAAGKAANWAQTKGHNLTTKITLDKLLQAWNKAGKPTDSAQLMQMMLGAGVSQQVIDSVYASMKIPKTSSAPAQQPDVYGRREPTMAAPAAKAAPARTQNVPANSPWNYASAVKAAGVGQPTQPGAAAKTAQAGATPSWADPKSGDYVGRREVARRMAAQPQAAKASTPAAPQWGASTGAYSQTADRGAYSRNTETVDEDNGVKFAAEVGSKALGNANMGLLIKAYHARTPRITLHFGDKSIDLDNEDIEAIARYYDETLTDPNDRWNFIYQTMSRADKLTALLAKIGRRSEKAVQQPGLFQEANKKKDDEEGIGKVHDVALQRAISKSKAAFPTAQSGIQALMKSFAQDQERDQDEFEKVRRADRRQDQLLAQISQVDKDQEKELQDLDNQNNTLAQRLQQLQSVNSKLEKQLAAMSGRKKTKTTSEPSNVGVATEPARTSKSVSTEPKAEPKSAPKSTSTAKTPNVSYKISSKPAAKAKDTDVIASPAKTAPPSFGRFRNTDIQDIAHRMLDMPHKTGELEKTAAAELPALQNNPSPSITPTAANDDQKQKELFAAENKEQEADYGDEYQDMVARVGQKAKQQEKDKPVDIADLARRLAAIETSKKK